MAATTGTPPDDAIPDPAVEPAGSRPHPCDPPSDTALTVPRARPWTCPGCGAAWKLGTVASRDGKATSVVWRERVPDDAPAGRTVRWEVLPDGRTATSVTPGLSAPHIHPRCGGSYTCDRCARRPDPADPDGPWRRLDRARRALADIDALATSWDGTQAHAARLLAGTIRQAAARELG